MRKLEEFYFLIVSFHLQRPFLPQNTSLWTVSGHQTVISKSREISGCQHAVSAISDKQKGGNLFLSFLLFSTVLALIA